MMESRVLLALAAILSSALTCSALSNKTLDVPFPEAPDTATNTVQDNFLGISWELFPLNYLCAYLVKLWFGPVV